MDSVNVTIVAAGEADLVLGSETLVGSFQQAPWSAESSFEETAAMVYHSNVLILDLDHEYAPVLAGMWAAWQVAEQAFGQGIVHGPLVGFHKSKQDWANALVPKQFESIEEAANWLNLEASTWTTGTEEPTIEVAKG